MAPRTVLFHTKTPLSLSLGYCTSVLYAVHVLDTTMSKPEKKTSGPKRKRKGSGKGKQKAGTSKKPKSVEPIVQLMETDEVDQHRCVTV